MNIFLEKVRITICTSLVPLRTSTEAYTAALYLFEALTLPSEHSVVLLNSDGRVQSDKDGFLEKASTSRSHYSRKM